ncbi:MAG: ShlB/FhaC/HecB family hemolysin secretion/activation protein [Janthinobacterium lividum]
MTIVPSRPRILSSIAVLLLAASGSALAQTASQVTPPSFAPDGAQPHLQPIVTGLPLAPQTPAAGEGQRTVHLREVQLYGSMPALQGASAVMVQRLQNQTVTIDDIYAAAHALEAAYAQAGYILMRVDLVPDQIKDDRPLRLNLVSAYIDRIDIAGVSGRDQARIAATLNPLVGHRDMTLAEIERRLMFAEQPAGTSLRAVILPGDVPDAKILSVDVVTRAADGFVGVGNGYGSALGRDWVSAGIDINSPSGYGERFYLRAAGHPSLGDSGFFSSTSRNRVLAAGVVLPLDITGSSLNLEYTDARTVAPIDDLSTPVSSHYKRLSVRYKTDYIGGRDWMTSQEIGFDATEERFGLAGNDTAALDRLRILRFANAFAWHVPNSGVLTGRMEFSVGLDKFGARSAEEDYENGTTLSRAGSTDTLRKLGLNLDYTQAFTPHLALDVKGRGQTSFSTPLVYSEMLNIASPDGLSSFNWGTLLGDAGYVVRGELSSPWQLSERGVTIGVIPYLFAGYGAVFRYDATQYEHSAVHAADFGVGVRLVSAPNFHALGLRGATVTVELGKQHRDDGRSNATQLSVTGVMQF